MFPFNAASPQTEAIASLFNLIALLAGLILVVVCLGIGIAVLRYRRRSATVEPTQLEGHTGLEIAWTLLPLLLLLVVSFISIRTMAAADASVPAGAQPDLLITGHQWWWEVHYPAAGVFTANEIHIPSGRRVLIELTSADVIHSYWIPALGRKVDMLPRQRRMLWFEAPTPGVYSGACTEFCGAQHAWMRLRLIAQTPAEFDAWLLQQAQPAAAPTVTMAEQGAQLFVERTCSSCHAIAGTEAVARVGPDLSHVASRATLAAGLLENTPENLAKWLADPHALKPGTLMPNLRLTHDEVQQLTAYLETLQ